MLKTAISLLALTLLLAASAEPTAIDQTNPKGLAGSYARFLVQKHAAGGHFARLFTQGYQVILQRYYVAAIAATAKVEGEGSDLRCEVGPVAVTGQKAVASLKHVWRAAKAAEPLERKIQIHMEVQDGRWWIRETKYRRIYEISQGLDDLPNFSAHYLSNHGAEPQG